MVKNQHPASCPALLRVAAIGFALLVWQPLPVAAHETDQYTLPVGRAFADLGPHLSRIVYGAVVEAVDKTNTAIKLSLDWDGRPTQRTASLQSADFIAGETWRQLFAAFPTVELLDNGLAGERFRAEYPGLVVVYAPEQSIYDDPLLMVDLTKLVRLLFRAGTVNADGTLFGTDKIVHFIHMGRIYHVAYEAARQKGLGEHESVAQAFAASDNLFLSENWMLGGLTTGINANADLAADYAGFKFYRNLTEDVRIGHRVMPAMLVRQGPYWRPSDHVRPDSDFFTAFVTPHWNEVFNPNRYSVVSRDRVRAIVRSRCADVLDWYRDEHGRRLSQAQFLQIEEELSTWYGEDYGYQSDGKDRVSVATTCFQSAQADSGAQTSAGAPARVRTQNAAAGGDGGQQQATFRKTSQPDRGRRASVDEFGRTPLWWAAKGGQLERVEALLAQGADANAVDCDGETPLHVAARWGRAAVAEALLSHGASPYAKALYGTTPLQVAVQESQVDTARGLLRRGADANTRDLFGETPLHDAVSLGHLELVALLLDFGADPAATDNSGNTPLQLATRSGNEALVRLLSAHQRSAKARRVGSAPSCDKTSLPGAFRLCVN